MHAKSIFNIQTTVIKNPDEFLILFQCKRNEACL